MAQSRQPVTSVNTDTQPDAASLTAAGGDPALAGNAAVARISDGGQSMQQTLVDLLGPQALALDLSSDTPQLQAAAAKVVANVQKTAGSGAQPASLVTDLKAEILKEVVGLVGILPDGKVLDDKIKSFYQGASAEVWAAILLAAVASYYTGQVPKLTHDFELGDKSTITPTVQLGGFHEQFLQALSLSLKYQASTNVSLSAGINRDFTGKGTTLTLGAIDDDIFDIAGQHVSATLGYSLNTTLGKRATQKLSQALKMSYQGYQLQLSNTLTYSATPGAKAPKGGLPPTSLGDSLTEQVTSPQFSMLGIEDFQLTGFATENMGDGAKPSTIGVGISAPLANTGFTVSLRDIQSMTGGTGGGNTISVDFMRGKMDIGVSYGPSDMSASFPGVSSNPTFERDAQAGSGHVVKLTVGFKF